jgi:HAD superfamily hydrolase (TIGR01509 family)
MAEEIRAIIFDIGGVILRTEDFYSRSALAKRFGLTRQQIEDLVFNSDSAIEASVGKKTAEEHFRYVWDSLLVPEKERQTCEDEFWDGDSIDMTLISFLREQKGIRRIALLSNAWSDLRFRLENEYKCMDAFDVSIFSYEVGMVKPDPAIYRLALERVGAEPSEAIFVDDNEPNVAAAAALGIHAIRFQNTSQVLSEIRKLL